MYSLLTKNKANERKTEKERTNEQEEGEKISEHTFITINKHTHIHTNRHITKK